MKKFTLIGIIFILTGCTYSNPKSDTTINSPNQAEQLCSQLKRQIVFNASSQPQVGAASTIERTQMLHLYEKYNCGKIEKKSK